jgi:hypothetical protein
MNDRTHELLYRNLQEVFGGWRPFACRRFPDLHRGATAEMDCRKRITSA